MNQSLKQGEEKDKLTAGSLSPKRTGESLLLLLQL